MPAPREVERDLVDLGVAAVDAEHLVKLDMLEDGDVEQVLAARTGSGC